MSGIGTGYDLSATTYSPDGKVFQTEYAQKAVDNSSTVVGLKCKDGVVLGVEKVVVSKLLVENSNRRVYNVDRHAGAAVAGLAPDGRMIVNRAMDEATNYKSFYGEPIPGHVLAERIASYVHLFNLYWSFRPFGSTLLLAAHDKSGPQLYCIEPSGTCVRYFGTAVGKGRQAARNEIEKLNLKDMTARQAVTEVAKILHKVHDEDGKPFELEVSWVCEESGGQHQRVPEALMAEAVAAAKAAMADSDMDE
uniref:Proteasome subunit alpha type-3 n=1 Tax=Chlamydomonas leiostraca TaxID=1034604 RepID=A0A7S0WL28_9CHLO|mmetsp:Transcript_17304/g.43420  ORF Transcript_17304/g.43420 Transcript_17304/m.43420 type:complete len:250 (+) Transcript_17304:62-811(+)|eukprot:CAMPEP_0202869050 /NCGR_PEP_ID=MMETSP1391-20130828/11740_1 /ASSEMBLY_ACC=CAM_ASM_000867 /TAXON_ID=1034604 /ORGANISM="Chlamydomonas leiostraca, Strain SAG 11-49" /LENGTH=249 /DNA_ID=CAMNT_0049549299 /DNA_START=99 /DNA_END=848 /DNA_ORIENTATION=-